MNPERGDVIFAVRFCGVFFHYGIYIGGGLVIHYNTDSSQTPSHNAIIKTSFEDFASNDPVYIDPTDKKYSKENTAKKAEELLGTGRGEYNLATNNCEHFCNLCRKNSKSSEQVWNAAWSITYDVLKKFTLIVNTLKETSFLANPFAYISFEAIKSGIYNFVTYLIKKVLYNTAGNMLRVLYSNYEKVNYIKPNIPIGYGLDSILKRCPNCGAPMPIENNKCLSCGTNTKEEIYKHQCPDCGADFYFGETKCLYCGRYLTNVDCLSSNNSGNESKLSDSPSNNNERTNKNSGGDLSKIAQVYLMNQMINQTMQNQLFLQQNTVSMSKPMSVTTYPQYKICKNGQVLDPISFDELKRMVEQGEIHSDTKVYEFIREGGNSTFKEVKNVEGMEAFFLND